jgi:hypothetical protein
MDPKKKHYSPNKQTNKNSGCQKCQELEDFGKLSISLSLSLSLDKKKTTPKKLWVVRMQKMFEGFGNSVAKNVEDLV